MLSTGMLATRTANLEPPDAIFARCARAAYRTPPPLPGTDWWFWHVASSGAAAAIFIEFVWRDATNGRAQLVRTPADLVHPWARPSSFSRRFRDSDPTRAAVTQTSAHTRIDVHGP